VTANISAPSVPVLMCSSLVLLVEFNHLQYFILNLQVFYVYGPEIIGVRFGFTRGMPLSLFCFIFIAQCFELFVVVEISATFAKELASFVRVRTSISVGYNQYYFLRRREVVRRKAG
jgi:hypothetical protein